MSIFEDNESFFYNTLKFSGENLSKDELLRFTPANGENSITVSCGGKTTEFTLSGLEVEGIEITKLPDNTKFNAEQQYDVPGNFKGMEVKVSYSNGTNETFNYEDNSDFFMYELEYSGECVDEYGVSFTPASGDNKVIVTCGGQLAEFTIIGV